VFGIFSPRYLKLAKHYRHALSHVINYRRDVLPVADLEELENLREELLCAMRGRNRAACESIEKKIDNAIGRVAPLEPNSWIKENVEAFLVVLVIVGGIRAYGVQPFRIPTASMQPTLYGITATVTNEDPPNWLIRAFDFAWAGRWHLNLRADEDVTVRDLQERTYANFFTFTTIVFDKKSETVFAPAMQLGDKDRGGVFDIKLGRRYKKGDPIAVGYVDTGDQLFVDKASYHFVPPKRGNVFVFRTTGIPLIQMGLPPNIDSQHYIKRLAGVPGDKLRIAAPNLYINGELARGEMFRRVMSCENGYSGYTNPHHPPPYNSFLSGPTETFIVPAGKYFALGDNSKNSLDSRAWGTVPEEHVAGRALFVYWPFTKRWGFIW